MKKPPNKVTFVYPEGSPDSKIAIVGEQPGKTEVRSGKIFSGPAGRQLNECLQSANVSRFECYLTNTIKDLDMPLEKYINLSNPKRPLVTLEGQLYIDMLKEELCECSANVLVAVGNPALFALTGRVGITKWRGSVLESSLLSGRKVVPCIHPATVIPPKNQFLNKHLIVFDLKRAKKEGEFPEIRNKERGIATSPTFYEVMGFLDHCRENGWAGATVDYDIELYNEEVSCISFASSELNVMCIPFVGPQGDYFTLEQEAEIWKLIARILEDENIRKRGQNIAFDSHFLLRKYGIRAENLDDTMVAQKILFPDYPVGLHFITTMYTDIPYYKDDGKKWFRAGGAWEALWRYNSLDSLSCAEAHPKQMADLTRQGNLDTYERQRKLIPPLVYMMERGIRVDVEGMRKEEEDCGRRIEELQEQLNRLVGRDINPNSTQQLAQYFYVEKGFPPYKKRGGGLTTDDNALKRLARKGCAEASIVRTIRSLVKLQSSYLNVEKVDRDNRIRCSYNPVGTRFSRISSSENIFGTGMNLQNWPHEMQKYLLFDEGYMGYFFDLAQAENRVVAYVGRVLPMIEAFEAGKDVHRLTAGLIFGKPADQISNEIGSSPLSGARYSERSWGRIANHGLNYDLGYKNFALKYELVESVAKTTVERYHAAYPEVRRVYHTMVKEQLSKDRTLTNLFGRKTLFLDQWGDSLFKEAYSCIPQGTVGDKINEQGLNFIYYNQDDFASVELLRQDHDSIGFQIPLSVSWTQHAIALLKIKKSLETPLKWRDTEFTIPVDLTMGSDHYVDGNRCIEIKHQDIPTSVEGLARKLEENYNDLQTNRNHT